MPDPCKECLVQACCTLVCTDKTTFLDLCIRDLTAFIDNNDIIKGNGSIKRKLLDRTKIRLESICEKNNNDIRKITLRGLS